MRRPIREGLLIESRAIRGREEDEDEFGGSDD